MSVFSSPCFVSGIVEIESKIKIENELGISYNIKITTIHPNDENPDNNVKVKQVITSENKPPEKPTIKGPTRGKTGEDYNYTISTSDPNGNDVYYWILWFEGCPGVFWDGPYKSGEEIKKSYIWENEGTHSIQVKAKDVNGIESDWATFEVILPKKKSTINIPFLYFLEHYPDSFPLLRQILGL